MRSQQHPEQSAAESAISIEGPDPAATAQAPAVDSPGLGVAAPAPAIRVARPNRVCTPPIANSSVWPMTIDELLEADHPARAVWSYVEGLDLTPLYDRIRARGSLAGRPAIDPRLLVALWLYAILSRL